MILIIVSNWQNLKDGFKKPESQSEFVKKLLINELYDQNMDYIFNIIF